MDAILFWFFFSVVVAIIASNRGRSGFGWFLLSAVISPLLSLILVLVLKNLSVQVIEPSPTTHVKCPDCREFVLKDAKVCKHCGCKLLPQI